MMSSLKKEDRTDLGVLSQFALHSHLASNGAHDSWVVCGRFGRPHGVKGEVRIWGYNHHSDLLQEGMKLFIGPHPKYPNSPTLPATHCLIVERVRSDSKGLLVSFKQINNRDQAQVLNHMAWLSTREHFLPLDEDEFYLLDLVGAEGKAVDPSINKEDLTPELIETAQSVGKLTGLLEAGAGELLIFESQTFGEVMVPNQEPFVLVIDLEHKRVILRAIPGLLEGGL